VRERIQLSEGRLYGEPDGGLGGVQSRVQGLQGSIAELTTEYLKVRDDRTALAARLARLEHLGADALPQAADLPVGSDALDGLRRDLTSREAELASARAVYKDKHPKLVALESECAAIRTHIAEELGRVIAGMHTELSTLAAREAQLRASLDSNQRQMGLEQSRTQHYAVSERELKTDQDLYALLQSKLQEGGIEGFMKSPLVDIVDPAAVAKDPVRPRKLLNLAILAVVGLLTGTGISFVGYATRRTLHEPEDVEREIGVPVIGVLPKRSYGLTL